MKKVRETRSPLLSIMFFSRIFTFDPPGISFILNTNKERDKGWQIMTIF